MKVKVKISRIEAIKDPTGKTGIRVDFVEEKKLPHGIVIQGQSEEARMVQNIVRALRQSGLPPFQVQQDVVVPRLVLFLSDEEREVLRIPLEAGKYYYIELKEGTINITPA